MLDDQVDQCNPLTSVDPRIHVDQAHPRETLLL